MKRHRADLVSLIFGLVFVLIAARQAVTGWFNVDLPALGWLAAVALLVLGTVGLVGAIRGARDEDAPAEPDRGTDW